MAGAVKEVKGVERKREGEEERKCNEAKIK